MFAGRFTGITGGGGGGVSGENERTRSWNVSRSPRDKPIEPVSRLSVNLSVFESVVVQTASGSTIRGRVNGYVPIPEIIDRVKLLDGLVLVRVYMHIRLIHILRFNR